MKLLTIAICLTLTQFASAQEFVSGKELFDQINEFRRKNSRPALIYDSSMQKSADKWAKRMINKGMEHNQRCKCWENIATSYDYNFIELWIGSMGHRMNLLARGTKGVIAVSRYKDTRLKYAVFRVYK